MSNSKVLLRVDT